MSPSHVPDAPRIESRAEFEAAIRWSLDASAARNARRIVWADGDFADWPLDDVALLAALTAWLQRPQRKLVLLARDYAAIVREHPRFVAWRRDWSHAVEAYALPEDVPLSLPTLAVDDGTVGVHLIDHVHWRGQASLDAMTAHRWREQLDALLQRSEAAFAVHQLGL